MSEVTASDPVPPAGQPPDERLLSADRGMLAWLRAAATTHADQPALRQLGEDITYRQLSGRLTTISANLRRRSVERGDVVALCAGRSADLVAALLATVNIGAVSCPLDLRQAPDRGRRLLDRLRPRLVVADAEVADLVPGACPLSDLAERPTDDDSHSNDLHAWPTPGELVYVTQTSGSTGEPKLVPVPHRALANRIAWAQQRYPLGTGDTVLFAGSLAFDFAFWEIIAPLCVGAGVAVAPEGMEAEPALLANFIATARVTVAHFVPSLLADFIEAVDPAALAGCGPRSRGTRSLAPKSGSTSTDRLRRALTCWLAR